MAALPSSSDSPPVEADGASRRGARTRAEQDLPGASASPGLARWIGPLAAALVGALPILLVFGPGVIDPWSVGWMLAGPLGPDPVQYLLGWTYFVRSPWMLPPGLNPDYGLELGTSIFYADAIPLLALPLKALRGLVPVPQYWGLWLLGCGVAQAVLAWRLLGLVTAHPLARVAGAGLFVLLPMLLTRMGGHLALAGQWVLLAALWLALRPKGQGVRQGGAWVLLLLATSLIHAYLLAMVLAMWGADWLRRALAVAKGERAGGGAAGLAAEAVAAPGAVLFGLWVAGFFALRRGFDAPGYGELGLDLLAPFDPTEWGSLLPPLPGPGHIEAGGSYLGLGAILLLAAGVAAWMRRPRRPLIRPVLRRNWPLALALVGMLGFAITHRMTVGGVAVTLFEPPGWALSLAGALRASERFFWPLAYALLLGAAGLVAQVWGGRRAGLLFAALLVVQAVDMAPSLARLRSYVADAPRVAPERLPDPFWDEAGRVYRRVRAVPAANQGEHWESVARFAARHGLPTDAVYLARIDDEAVRALVEAVTARIAAGDFEPATLYVLRDAATPRLAAAAYDPARDLLAEIDGITVLAPGWLREHAVPSGARLVGRPSAEVVAQRPAAAERPSE
mgnify:CR=1 FL=1